MTSTAIIGFCFKVFLVLTLSVGAFGAKAPEARESSKKMSSGDIQKKIESIEKSNQTISENITKLETELTGVDTLPECLTAWYMCNAADQRKISRYLADNPSIGSEEELKVKVKSLRGFKAKLDANKNTINTMKASLEDAKQGEAVGRVQSTEQNVEALKEGLSELKEQTNDLLARVNDLSNKVKDVGNYVTGQQLKQAMEKLLNSKDMCQRIKFCMDNTTKDGKLIEHQTIEQIFKDAKINMGSSEQTQSPKESNGTN